MATWANVLDQDAAVGSSPSAPAGKGGPPGEDGILMNSLAYANKCRECAKTLDAGLAAWFNRDGEPGRKTTCVQCHDAKGPSIAPEEEDPNVATQKKASKKRKAVAKMTPELLCDPQKGITAMYKAFPAMRFKGKGHEAADLRRLLAKYREWGHTLLPEMEFFDLMEKVEKLKHNARVRDRVNFVRSVQQGLCSIDDVDDYGLADYGDVEHGVRYEDVGEDTGEALSACHGISKEQRELMERNRAMAMAKQSAAAARPAAAAAQGQAAAGEEVDFEAEWAAEMNGFDDDEAAFALDAEAEMDMGMDFDDEEEMMAAAEKSPAAQSVAAQSVAAQSVAAQSAAAQSAAAPGPGASLPAQAQQATAAVLPAETGAEEASPAEAAAARARAQAMADALALDEDEDEEEGGEALVDEASRGGAETQAWGTATEGSEEQSEAAPRAGAETHAWGTATNDDADSEDELIAPMGRAGAETQAWGTATQDAELSEDE